MCVWSFVSDFTVLIRCFNSMWLSTPTIHLTWLELNPTRIISFQTKFRHSLNYSKEKVNSRSNVDQFQFFVFDSNQFRFMISITNQSPKWREITKHAMFRVEHPVDHFRTLIFRYRLVLNWWPIPKRSFLLLNTKVKVVWSLVSVRNGKKSP